MRPFLATLLLASAAFAQAADCQRVKIANPASAGDDLLGFSVAVGGDTLVVGAPFNDDYGVNRGIALISRRKAGVWSAPEELTHGDAARGTIVGRAMHIHGDRLALALGNSAEIWEKNGAGEWLPAWEVFDDDTFCCNQYGESIGLFRTVLAVGAPYDNSGRTEGGSVYVYERDSGGAWSQTAELWPADVYPMDRFGRSVAVGRNRVVAGAPEDDDLGFASGAVYVFDKDPNTGWFEAAKLLPSDGGTQDTFGASVAVAGDTVLVGAPWDFGSGSRLGAVYVFEEVGPGLWLERQKIAPPIAGDLYDNFGYAIDVDGDVAVIGARLGGVLQGGAAFVFVRDGAGVWSEQGQLLPADAAPFAEFGNAVAVSGTTAVIGAWRDDEAAVDSGSAYVFRVGPDADGDGHMDACACRGDLTGDFVIELADLAIQLAHYGVLTGAEPEDGDLDDDGDVDLADLAELLSAFGTGCQ